ncbi:hypothetical protein [Ancylobacter sp. G4_0304]|uniref:hypothetical protein n=1 Tax=Ancylobacter sp. G4_0304 TaxID=3114289 RepID=UPI0039C6916F
MAKRATKATAGAEKPAGTDNPESKTGPADETLSSAGRGESSEGNSEEAKPVDKVDGEAAQALGRKPPADVAEVASAPERRLFIAASLIKRDGQRFAPFDTMTLTEDEHAPLFRAGAVAVPWEAGGRAVEP